MIPMPNAHDSNIEFVYTTHGLLQLVSECLDPDGQGVDLVAELNGHAVVILGLYAQLVELALQFAVGCSKVT